MSTATEAPGYSHTQRAPLCLLLCGPALACFALAWLVGSAPANTMLIAVGLCLVLLAPTFHYLAVVDKGERLEIRFGPIPCFAGR